MKKFFTFLFNAIFLFMIAKNAFSFEIKSLDFKNMGFIPKKYTCAGENKSFSLEWSNAPKTAKSFAIIVKDLDAPGGYYHWIVFDIPPTFTKLNSKVNSKAYKQGLNSANEIGYIGPCPQAGPPLHRYLITIYALNIPALNLPQGASLQEIKTKMQNHIIDTAQTIGLFSLK